MVVQRGISSMAPPENYLALELRVLSFSQQKNTSIILKFASESELVDCSQKVNAWKLK
jgi:hypothetical protein